MYRTFILIILIISIIMITASISHSLGSVNNTKTKVVYRYIPRTLVEEQNEPTKVSDIFAPMFQQKSTWIGEVNDLDFKKREAINQYFVSQI